jgi:hypothetical protein
MYTINCTHNHIVEKIYNGNFIITSMSNLIVNNKLIAHGYKNWLHMTRFLLLIFVTCIKTWEFSKDTNKQWKQQGYNARSYPKLVFKWSKVIGLYLYLYGSKDLVQRSFHQDFHMPIIQKNLFSIQVNNKSTISELQINYKLITSS